MIHVHTNDIEELTFQMILNRCIEYLPFDWSVGNKCNFLAWNTNCFQTINCGRSCFY